ncbi:MAG: hypothetical protein KDJ97_36920 [Anaerolineae bacterium]|nr:hypothetical protein [Anaerolineae bacterium]
MTGIRRYIPVQLIIWIIVCLILGVISGPIIQATASEEQLTRNVLLSAIPFILYFVTIVLFFIALIVIAANVLNHKIPANVYGPIEKIIIAGIIIGIVGMFQPWWFPGFRLGFFLLLISTLAFILWSHVTPKGRQQEETAGSVSISEFERQEAS